MYLVDTHTHLFSKEFNHDIDTVIQQAVSKGVGKMFLPNIDEESYANMMSVCDQYPQYCFPMIGLHPCSVYNDYKPTLDRIFSNIKDKRFYAIGETGIDLYWDKSYVDEQKLSFRLHLEKAIEYKLPVVIHTRNSFAETFEIVKEMKESSLKGIFHCFSGSLKEAEMIMSLNDFKMGIGGVLTFKNSSLPEVLKHVSMEYLVLETDSPYLAPVPYRGKRNESSFLCLIAEKLADIKGMDVEDIAKITTLNAGEVFGI